MITRAQAPAHELRDRVAAVEGAGHPSAEERTQLVGLLTRVVDGHAPELRW